MHKMTFDQAEFKYVLVVIIVVVSGRRLLQKNKKTKVHWSSSRVYA